MAFLRRVFALLVMQYMTVLVVASPFALIQAQPNSARKQGHGTGDRQTIVHEKRRKEIPG